MVYGCIFLASVLAACSSSSDPRLTPKQEIKVREDVRATETIKMRVINHFKDPESVQIRGVQLYRQVPADGTGAEVLSYTLCGEANAKNSFGGYVGYRRFFYTALTDSNGRIREDNNWFELEPDDAQQVNMFIKAYQDQCRDTVIAASGQDSGSTTKPDKADTKSPNKLVRLPAGSNELINLEKNGWDISESNDRGDFWTHLSRRSEQGTASAMLEIVCTNGRLDSIFVRTNIRRNDGDSVPVQLNFNNSVTEKRLWIAKGVSIVSDNPNVFVKQLSEGSEVAVQYTTDQKHNQTATFNTNGLKENLEFISDLCRVN